MDSVTIEQLNEMGTKMQTELNAINLSISDLKHTIEVQNLTFLKQGDLCYRKKENMIPEAVALFNDEVFRERSENFIDHHMASDGVRSILKYHYDDYILKSRDNAVKWISFLKTIGGLLAFLYAGYVGMTMNQTQAAIIEILKQAH